MTKVLNASLSLSHGAFSVTLTSFNGDCLARFTISAHSTLAELERVLRDQNGPLSPWHEYDWLLPESLWLIYSGESRLLDANMECVAGKLVILKREAAEAWLDAFPNTGKNLKALRLNKSNQKPWTVETAPAVSTEETSDLIDEALRNYTVFPQSRSRFVQIFGKLTSSYEQISPRLLRQVFEFQCLDWINQPVAKVQYSIFQSWEELAGVAATSMVDVLEKAPPVILPLLPMNRPGGLILFGERFPQNIKDLDVQTWCVSNDMHSDISWANVALALLSLEWNPSNKDSSFSKLLEVRPTEPDEFSTLTDQEVFHMVNVQLRLSCCGVAEVKGLINETCVKTLAHLLDFQLIIIEFQSCPVLKAELNSLKPDDHHRGTLVLVTYIPPSCKVPIVSGSHRMILCYHAAKSEARHRSRSPKKNGHVQGWFIQSTNFLLPPGWPPESGNYSAGRLALDNWRITNSFKLNNHGD